MRPRAAASPLRWPSASEPSIVSCACLLLGWSNRGAIMTRVAPRLGVSSVEEAQGLGGCRSVRRGERRGAHPEQPDAPAQIDIPEALAGGPPDRAQVLGGHGQGLRSGHRAEVVVAQL